MDNKSTTMARNRELFISCKAGKTKGPELTEKEFRTNIDLAWIVTQEFAARNQPKIEPIKEPEPVFTSDHQPCSGCGGIFFLRTGTCHVCQTCGDSQGCS